VKRVATFFLVLLLSAGGASQARGDLHVACDVPQSTPGQSVAVAALARVATSPSPDVLGGWSGRSLSPALPPAALDAATTVRELPGLAGSASLFVSAMLSLGTWQVVRSAKRLHLLDTFPDWYHTGGPFQIGHAVAFDFEFHAPPPCLFDVPDDDVGFAPSPERWRYDDRPAGHPQQVVAPAAPRAPPYSC